MTIFDIVQQVLTLLEDPNAWCRGQFAITYKGRSVSVHDSSAYRWCLVGAIAKYTQYDLELRSAVTVHLEHIYECKDLSRFNDRHGYDAVITGLRKALC